MTSYVNPFSGQTIQPSQVGYELLTIAVNTELQWPVNGNNSLVVANIIDVDATVAGLDLILPAAEQVSTGQSILINNIGANSFTVTDNGGNTIITIASGVAEYIYLIDNTSINGVWSSVTFGAGTSSASAATLAGYGLKAITTTLNQAYNLVAYNSDSALGAGDRAEFAVWQGGVGTLTLPTANVVGNNWFVMIRNNGTGILTVTPQGTDTIDGNSSQQLQLTESFVVVSNGVNGFNSFGYGQSAQFFYTQLAKTVTGGTVTLNTSEAANVIQEYFGVLASNCTIILPATVQQYSVNNQTTGSYTLTFSTGIVGSTDFTLPQGQTAIIICDGTNVYNASTAAVGAVTSLTLGAGSAAAPSLNFQGSTDTGVYSPASNQMGVACAGVNVATFTGTEFLIPVGISGGTF